MRLGLVTKLDEKSGCWVSVFCCWIDPYRSIRFARLQTRHGISASYQATRHVPTDSPSGLSADRVNSATCISRSVRVRVFILCHIKQTQIYKNSTVVTKNVREEFQPTALFQMDEDDPLEISFFPSWTNKDPGYLFPNGNLKHLHSNHG